MMKLLSISTVFFLITILVSCKQKSTYKKQEIKDKIMVVLIEQEKNWNKGNIEKYMDGYYRSDSLRFVSGGNVRYGWEKTLEGYKNTYPDKSIMGKLTFSEIDIKVISENDALVFGRWKLHRKNDNPEGLFTLLFQKTKDTWRIVHDHTSSLK